MWTRHSASPDTVLALGGHGIREVELVAVELLGETSAGITAPAMAPLQAPLAEH